MTRKEFLSGTPFEITGVSGQYKYDEVYGGELLLFVNGEWFYAVLINAIGDETFEVAAIVRDNIKKRNYRIRYDECEEL